MSGSYQGSMVVSLAGRDRGAVCVVLREEEEYLLIADGRLRKVEAPKKKKRKHVRLITGENGAPIRFDGKALTNRFVREWLKANAGRVQI